MFPAIIKIRPNIILFIIIIFFQLSSEFHAFMATVDRLIILNKTLNFISYFFILFWISFMCLVPGLIPIDQFDLLKLK